MIFPHDTDAEERLAAIAVLSCRGADLAYDRGVDGEHFHTPRLGRIYQAAVDCPETDPDARRAAIATAAGEPEGALDQLERLERISICDDSGHYARRVLETAQARRRIDELLGGLEALIGPFQVEVAG